ncbi:transcriptional regulator Kaiso-like [Arapaima gigas]
MWRKWRDGCRAWTGAPCRPRAEPQGVCSGGRKGRGPRLLMETHACKQGMTGLKLISATDTRYSESLLRSFDEQRKAGLFCDVTVVVRGRTFRAHRNVLSASSSYFHERLSAAADVIELDFRPEVFQEVLNYVYSSKIVRVRSDLLKELIECGRALGVRFIANLGFPLSHVKGLPGLSRDDGEAQGRVRLSDGTREPAKSDPCRISAAMPVITDAFSLSSQTFENCNSILDKNDGSGDGGEDDDDVLFVSKQEPQHKGVSSSTNENSECSDVEYVDSLSAENLSVKEKRQRSPSGRRMFAKNNDAATRRNSGAPLAAAEKSMPSESISSQAQPDSTSAKTPSSLSPSSAASVGGSCASPAASSGGGEDPRRRVSSSEGYKVSGVQKKRVTTIIEESSSNPGDFKLKLTDVWSSSGPGGAGKDENPCEMDSSLSTFKEIPQNGEYSRDGWPAERSAAVSQGWERVESPPLGPARNSLPGVRRRRKAKGTRNYYELIMDGKTFYVCVVCKRSYSCLTSLKRHFNIHSWEKEYPCRYCARVFALAEYRTKHELQHTGERRYQCLLCGLFFMNYQELCSHCKQAHKQHPSGRKERRDTDNKLYRLLPCKTLEIKNYSYVSDDCSATPVISEDGRMCHVNPGPEREPAGEPGGASSSQGRVLSWDEIFVDMGEDGEEHKGDAPEFEFIIPETTRLKTQQSGQRSRENWGVPVAPRTSGGSTRATDSPATPPLRTVTGGESSSQPWQALERREQSPSQPTSPPSSTTTH